MAILARIVVACAIATICDGAGELKQSCAVTGDEPTQPKSLSFCHKYNDEACCAPAIDAENVEMFDNMMSIGLSCRHRGDIRQHPTAKLYCMNCDPKQPQYERAEPFVPSQGDGNVWTFADYKANAGDASRQQGTNDDGIIESTLLVCDTWAMKEYGSTDLAKIGKFCTEDTNDSDARKAAKSESCSGKISDFTSPSNDKSNADAVARRKLWTDEAFGKGFVKDSIFKDCGYMKSSPCLDGNGDLIGDRDRFFCGDDFILPAANYGSVEDMLNADDFGPPGLDGFGLKIVENRPCTDDELDAAEADATKIQAGTDEHLAAEFTRFNPNCLRTAKQKLVYGYSTDSTMNAAWSALNFTDLGYIAADASAAQLEALGLKDDLCFNSAAAFVPSVVLAAGLFLLGLF